MKNLFFGLLLITQTSLASTLTGKLLVQSQSYKVNYDLIARLDNSELILKGGTEDNGVDNLRTSNSVRAINLANGLEERKDQNASFEYLSNGVVVDGYLLNTYVRGSAYYGKNLVTNNTLETNNGDRCLFYFSSSGMYLQDKCSFNGLEIKSGKLISFNESDEFEVNFSIHTINIIGKIEITNVVSKQKMGGNIYAKDTAKLVKLYLEIIGEENSDNLSAEKQVAVESFLGILQIYSKRLFR